MIKCGLSHKIWSVKYRIAIGVFNVIQFITDSTAYLPEDMVANYPIQVVSLSVLVDGETHKETEITNEVFYQKMKQAQSFPKSAQPGITDLMTAFETAVAAGHAVIGFFLSSAMSGTYQTACMIREELLETYPEAQIAVIDSQTNCMQMGYAVLSGAELAAEGKSFDEVVLAMRAHVNRSRFIFLPETLEYLKMGGRIGGAQALFGSLLQILPILTVKDGKTEVLQKVRTKKKAVDTMVQFVLDEIKAFGLGQVAVHHIESLAEGMALAAKLEALLNVAVPVVSIGPVIGTHVGPGAIGIAYDLQRSHSV